MSVLLSVLDEMHISVGDELPDSELADFTNSKTFRAIRCR